jgi:putative restriction endonuclease
MSGLDLDWRLRLAAFDRLRALREARGGLVTLAELEAGFEFEGERIPFTNTRRGIWRPRQLQGGPALSVVTVPRRPGRRPPYDDQVASDADFFLYKYQGTDPAEWTNAAVRLALTLRRPIIYFYGVAPGLYEPIFPCYVVADDPAHLEFRLAADVLTARPAPEDADASQFEARRGYETRAVKVRLHQHHFRELVVGAYRERCSVCRLHHVELLDAAHILPDRDERGRPEIPNGLALCKIHHGAFDVNILGVSPDYRIAIRADVLDEIDGPMLRHGLQDMDGHSIDVPRAERLKPNRDYLAERFERFRAA